jgi:hypothetical protein
LIAGIFFAIDVQWARSAKESVAWARSEIGDIPPERTIWYHGIWGFKYYAMEEGMKAFVQGQSRAVRDDYLLLPRAGVAVPRFELDLDGWEEVSSYRGGPVGHLKMSSYYNGTTPLSIGGRETVRVALYRRL